MSKAANAAESETIDYSKCPDGNSSVIAKIDGNTSSVVKKEDNSVSTLEKLAKLHDRGIIADEEFQQKKAEIFARMQNIPAFHLLLMAAGLFMLSCPSRIVCWLFAG